MDESKLTHEQKLHQCKMNLIAAVLWTAGGGITAYIAATLIKLFMFGDS